MKIFEKRLSKLEKELRSLYFSLYDYKKKLSVIEKNEQDKIAQTKLIEHTPEFIEAKFTHLNDGEYVIESEKKVQGIAPGQFAVIYDATGHLCYGSGVITGQKIQD